MDRASGGAAPRFDRATTISALLQDDEGWRISAGAETFHARMLVAADGRNSTVARLLGLLPRIEKERVALQTHLPLPEDFGDRVVLQFLPEGYSGQAPIGNGSSISASSANPRPCRRLRAWAETRFGVSARSHLADDHATASRRDRPAARRLFFIGDAARVVEPFTGEGISYALRSGELAAEAIRAIARTWR